MHFSHFSQCSASCSTSSGVIWPSASRSKTRLSGQLVTAAMFQAPAMMRKRERAAVLANPATKITQGGARISQKKCYDVEDFRRREFREKAQGRKSLGINDLALIISLEHSFHFCGDFALIVDKQDLPLRAHGQPFLVGGGEDKAVGLIIEQHAHFAALLIADLEPLLVCLVGLHPREWAKLEPVAGK